MHGQTRRPCPTGQKKKVFKKSHVFKELHKRSLFAILWCGSCSFIMIVGLAVGTATVAHSYLATVSVVICSSIFTVSAVFLTDRWWNNPRWGWRRPVLYIASISPEGYGGEPSQQDNAGKKTTQAHAGILFASAVLLIAYLSLGVGKYASIISSSATNTNNPVIPTFGSVILLISLLCTIFSAMTFFPGPVPNSLSFDREHHCDLHRNVD